MSLEKASIRRVVAVLGLVLGSAVDVPLAAAAPSVQGPAQASAGVGVGVGVGLAVVALPGATDAAWPLATSVYSEASLRPASMDDLHARVLCGEAPPVGAPPELRDLFDTVAALRGDDAPSRALLSEIARRFSVRALLVVRLDAGLPSARAFLPDAGVLDAATYGPDEASPVATWSAATHSLVRAFAPETPKLHAPALASRPVDAAQPHRAFYESGWFWGALGAAAVVGGAVFLATRDSGPSTIHLQAEVPR